MVFSSIGRLPSVDGRSARGRWTTPGLTRSVLDAGGDVYRRLPPSLEAPVERRLGSTPEPAEAAGADDVPQPCLAGEGTQGRPAGGARVGCAEERGRTRDRAAERVQVVLDALARH